MIQNHQRIIPLSSKHTEGHCPHPSRSCEPLYHKLFWLKAFIFCRNQLVATIKHMCTTENHVSKMMTKINLVNGER